jgi:uncharacterized protein YegP (UPF0339 family)
MKHDQPLGNIMKFVVYQETLESRWNWILKGKNGQIIAISPRGYTQKYNCEQAVKMVIAATSWTPVTIHLQPWSPNREENDAKPKSNVGDDQEGQTSFSTHGK